jgi:hypothetical protein
VNGQLAPGALNRAHPTIQDHTYEL